MGEAAVGGSRLRRVLLWTLATVAALSLVATAVFFGCALTPHRAEAEPLRRAQENPDVAVPADTATVTVEGMNHARFGAYGAQVGDEEPELSEQEAHERLAEATSLFLAS